MENQRNVSTNIRNESTNDTTQNMSFFENIHKGDNKLFESLIPNQRQQMLQQYKFAVDYCQLLTEHQDIDEGLK